MSKGFTRRECLKITGAALAGGSFRARVLAAPPSGPRFLRVSLPGGYDATNMLVPYSSDFYYEARPTIASARPDAAASSGALALDADWALAPALRDSLGPLYQQQQAAFVPFVRTQEPART